MRIFVFGSNLVGYWWGTLGVPMTKDPQVQAIEDALNALVAQAAGALILEINAGLVTACPVQTGRARRNFVPAVGAQFQGETSDGAAQAQGTLDVEAYKMGDGPLSITNNVGYIDALIGGSNPQADAGWDLVAIDQAQQTIQQRYNALNIDVTLGPSGAAVTVAPRLPDD